MKGCWLRVGRRFGKGNWRREEMGGWLFGRGFRLEKEQIQYSGRVKYDLTFSSVSLDANEVLFDEQRRLQQQRQKKQR